MSALAQFASAIAPLIEAVDSETFPRQLVDALKPMIEADDGSVLLYDQGRLPQIVLSQPAAGSDRSTLDAYLKGPFLLDPFYREAALKHQFGAFRLTDLAPKGFKESEYYNSWYRNCGYEDECGLLIDLGKQRFLNIALGVTGEGARFSKRQSSLLSEIFPTLAALCRHYWRERLNTSNNTDLRPPLHASLTAFGASVLTKRERQAIELVLLGNSTRVIAEKLGISTETVKLHRKHAYAKLDVSSQAELFYLFMEALAHSPGETGVDPLIAYHSKPAR